jgi:hypothetical protein
MGVAIAVLATGYATPVAAQTTFWACRVPAVGVLYIIADAAALCLDAGHVKFSWTDGGAPADGSITTAKLADNAVTSAKIANGTIAAADLAAGLVPGVEYAVDFTNIDPTTAATTAGSISLSHPASGFIFASGSAQIQCSASTVTTIGISNGGTGTEAWSYSAPSPAVGTYSYMFSHAVLPVTGAATATVNFNVQLFGTDNCTYFRVTNLQALYVPARY